MATTLIRPGRRGSGTASGRSVRAIRSERAAFQARRAARNGGNSRSAAS